jgi:FHS family L-fucose permease-like MFS transporter
MFGFLTCLNDTLIPHLKGLFDLSYFQAALVQFCFFAAYFLISIPAGKILETFGYKNGMMIGLMIAGFGCLLFYPAASFQSYAFFLAGLFILASGITVIQVSANPYVAVLGPAETSSSRLNLVQAFNSLGTTLAPLFGAKLILSTLQNEDRVARAAAVQMPYIGLGLTLFALATFVYFAKLPAISPEGGDESVPTQHSTYSSAWGAPHLVLGAIGIFLYVGAEVSIGSFLVNFLGEPHILSLPEEQAGHYVAFYWGAAMVGRFIGSGILQKTDAGRVLGIYAMIATTLVIATLINHGKIAMFTILSVGFFNSIMFPNIFTLSIKNLGKHTAQGSGILCAAIVGGAIVPLMQGALADAIGIHRSFILPIFCYLYIAFYGFKGSKYYNS